MSAWDLFTLNLGSPAVLAFALGVLAALARSDLRFPDAVTSLLSTYLLFAIGLKGGMRLREADPGDLWAPTLVTLALGVVTPVAAYLAARRVVRLGTADAASLAAHYGSVSAVTFTAAESFTRSAGTLEEGFLAALVALLEIPGIVVAMVIAGRVLRGGSTRAAAHEVLTGRSVLLLVGGLAIGALANESGRTAIEPLFVVLFPGVLCLFLLDLGTLTGQRLPQVRRAGPRLVAFALVTPLVFGMVGAAGGAVAGLSVGGTTVMATMAASASYIAAPAAVRTALPEADVGVSLGAALGVTFPFNLLVGIPLYAEMAARLA